MRIPTEQNKSKKATTRRLLERPLLKFVTDDNCDYSSSQYSRPKIKHRYFSQHIQITGTTY